MKKILISTIITVLTACGLYAQDVKFGIRGGVNMANMSVVNSTPISEGFNMRMAPGWGIFTELKYNPMVSFRLGVEYSGLGGTKDGMQAMPLMRLVTDMGNSIGMGITEQQLVALGVFATSMPPYYYANLKTAVKFDYVAIPLLAQFGWDIGTSPWRVYVNAGPFASFILSGKQVFKGTSNLFADESGASTLSNTWNTTWNFLQATGALPAEIISAVDEMLPVIDKKINEPVTSGETNITGEMKSVNFGVTGNVGIRYQHNRSCFFLEIGGNYGFFPAQDNDANGSNRLSAATVMVGYAFSLF